MMDEKEIPYGYCHCGCGGETKIISKTSKKEGRIKGEFNKFIRGHNAFKGNNLCVKCEDNIRQYGSYCRKCTNDSNKERYKKNTILYIKECPECFKQFRTSKSYKKYCSVECLRKAWRVKNNLAVVKLDKQYISRLFRYKTELQEEDITKELIELQFLKIKLQRIVRKTKLKGEQYVEHGGITGSVIGSNPEIANG
jgi:hypothetical protein